MVGTERMITERITHNSGSVTMMTDKQKDDRQSVWHT